MVGFYFIFCEAHVSMLRPDHHPALPEAGLGLCVLLGAPATEPCWRRVPSAVLGGKCWSKIAIQLLGHSLLALMEAVLCCLVVRALWLSLPGLGWPCRHCCHCWEPPSKWRAALPLPLIPHITPRGTKSSAFISCSFFCSDPDSWCEGVSAWASCLAWGESKCPCRGWGEGARLCRAGLGVEEKAGKGGRGRDRLPTKYSNTLNTLFFVFQSNRFLIKQCFSCFRCC